jgi:hypothetical protein
VSLICKEENRSYPEPNLAQVAAERVL